ncbi:MAG: DUF2867 domain-containing protein [Pseudomonadota bacterium]
MRVFKYVWALQPDENDRLGVKAQGDFFRDAISARVDQHDMTPSQLQLAIFTNMPSWVNNLMALRNRLVGMFGFDVGTPDLTPQSGDLNIGDNAGFLTVIEKYDDEVISFAEDKHMEFYLSVSKNNGCVVVSTLVNQKTLIGRVYVNMIVPFHYIIARTVINNAKKAKRL